MNKKSVYQTVLLTPEQILKFWPSLEKPISDSLVHSVNELSSFDVFKLALDDRVHVWLTVDNASKIVCVTTTRFLHYKRKKVMQMLTMTTLGSSIPDMFDQHEKFEEFAKVNSCSSIQAWGRKGWLRRLNPLRSKSGNKYKLQYYVFNMEI